MLPPLALPVGLGVELGIVGKGNGTAWGNLVSPGAGTQLVGLLEQPTRLSEHEPGLPAAGVGDESLDKAGKIMQKVGDREVEPRAVDRGLRARGSHARACGGGSPPGHQAGEHHGDGRRPRQAP